MKRTKGCKKGQGLINDLIDKSAINLVIPGTNFCGPQSNSQQLIDQGVRGRSLIDEAYRDHDSRYLKSKDPKKRQQADANLYAVATAIQGNSNYSWYERQVAGLVATAMAAKIRLGEGFGRVKKVKKKKKHKGRIIGTNIKSRQKQKKFTIQHKLFRKPAKRKTRNKNTYQSAL